MTNITEEDKMDLLQRAESIVRDEVLPAYIRQIEVLSATKPLATDDAGVWKLPRGEELYATALRTHTTTSLSAAEIHEIGVELVSSLNAEMDTLLRAQGMTTGTVVERVRALSRRPDQIYANTDAGREQLLHDLNAQVQAVRGRMPEIFGTLARAQLKIKRVPKDTEAGASAGYYKEGDLNGKRPGAYYINLRNPAEELPKFTLPRDGVLRRRSLR
jgi:uncharacterized protein (DUF885 family)